MDFLMIKSLILAMVINFAICYVLGMIGSIKVVEKIGYKKKWISYIPIVRMAVFNKLMENKVGNFLRGRLNILLIGVPFILCLLMMIGYLGLCVGVYIESVELIFLSTLILCIYGLLFCIYVSVYGYVVYKFFKEYSTKWFIWLLAFALFLYPVHSIGMIVFSKKMTEDSIKHE